MFRLRPLLRLHVRIGALLTVCFLAVGQSVSAAEQGPSQTEIARLIAELDNADYSVREQAQRRLAVLVGQKAVAPFLVAEMDRALAAPASFEARQRLTTLRRQLAGTPPAAAGKPNLEDVRRWLDELDGDSFAARTTAQDHLDAVLHDPAAGVVILTELQARLNSNRFSADARKTQLRLYREVRRSWLLSPVAWELPAVEPRQWQHWIDEFCRPIVADPPCCADTDDLEGAPADLDWEPRDPISEECLPVINALRSLSDLIARPDQAEAVRSALVERLEKTEDPAVQRRLERLLAWFEPAMVAEVWSDRQLRAIQHLLVDVPQMAGIIRPTHFDRIDDRVAHCVSGNSLTPGDYPVGVGIPHPEPDQPYMYHLINLPTPRRRMAFEHYARQSAADRLHALSERTTAWLLSQKRRLSLNELVLLRQLEPAVVSQFVGAYFRQVADHPRKDGDGAPSDYGILCKLLGEFGTRDALDSLADQAGRGLLAKLSNKMPINLAWSAALTIARRDPSTEVDQWLGSQIQLAVPLSAAAVPADVGATAAALLLGRHDRSAREFGIEPANDEYTDDAALDGFRFVDPESRQRAIDWWRSELERMAQRGNRG